MVPTPVSFPDCDVPEGWKREVSGPLVVLTPPEPGGTIVVTPVQGYPTWLDSRSLLEKLARQEMSTFSEVRSSDTIDVWSRHGLRGCVTDMAGLDAAGEPREWRTYVALEDGPFRYILFLQARPDRFAALRPQFLEVAQSIRPRATKTP
jgi:hypothetical protein